MIPKSGNRFLEKIMLEHESAGLSGSRDTAPASCNRLGFALRQQAMRGDANFDDPLT